MTTTELNRKFSEFVSLNIKQGGVKDTPENRTYLAAQAQTEWLLENAWKREQPNFWTNKHHKDTYFLTDNHKLELYVYDKETEELKLTEELPHTAV